MTKKKRYPTSQPPLKILALGGSVTYGVNLEHPEKEAFPFLAWPSPNKYVSNLAVRGTSADYFSLCTESIIGDEVYDVILLEFSLNGVIGLELLLTRLRQRFPEAIIIYVHVYSLVLDIRDKNNHTPYELKSHNVDKKWFWNSKKVKTDTSLVPYIKNQLKKVDAHFWQLPRLYPAIKSLHLFSADWHHLSKEGHALVAEGIREIISNVLSSRATPSSSVSAPHVGTWGDGDQCFTWYHSGKVPLQYKGDVSLTEFALEKHALEFHGPGQFTIHNNKPYDIPLYVTFMSQNDHYPPVRFYRDDGRVDIVDPRNFLVEGHVNRLGRIGMATPGTNVIRVVPNPHEHFIFPFRLTSVVMCHTGDKGEKELLRQRGYGLVGKW